MSTNETQGHKSVPTGESIDLEIDPDRVRRIVDAWEMFDDEQDALSTALEKGLTDLETTREMLDRESDDELEHPWRDDAPEAPDEEEDADLPDWETVEERAEWGDD